MAFISAISVRIIELTNVRDWSFYRLAFESAVPTSTLSNLILGKCKSCNAFTLLNICRGFRIDLSEFFASPLFSPENLDDD